MPLSQKKRLILIKPEAAYGTDSAPAIADAVLCTALDISPLEGSSVERDFIRPYFGNSGSIRVESYASVSFETEIAGSGAAATPPEWGSLLKASNFSENITPTAIVGTTTAIGAIDTTTVTLSVGATDDIYTGMSISFNALPAQYEIIKYVATTKIATLSKPLKAAVTASSPFSISPNVIYLPNNNFGSGQPRRLSENDDFRSSNSRWQS